MKEEEKALWGCWWEGHIPTYEQTNQRERQEWVGEGGLEQGRVKQSSNKGKEGQNEMVMQVGDGQTGSRFGGSSGHQILAPFPVLIRI